MFLITFHQHRDDYRPPRDRRRHSSAARFLYALAIRFFYALAICLGVFLCWLLGRLAGW